MSPQTTLGLFTHTTQKCPICNEQGTERSIELLPKAGIAKEFIHSDGKISHKWAEYDSIQEIFTKNKQKTGAPRRINCPICHKRGRINDYHPEESQPYIVEYVVVHEKIPGTWGKEGKHPKQRRCYITNEHRDIILKRLERFIQK